MFSLDLVTKGRINSFCLTDCGPSEGCNPDDQCGPDDNCGPDEKSGSDDSKKR